MKRTTPAGFAILLALLTFLPTLRAQTELGLPDRSQAAMVQQRLGVTDLTLRYNRPLIDGRQIWGALVPYGKVWRAGANFNTTFQTSDPVAIEGKSLPPAPTACT